MPSKLPYGLWLSLYKGTLLPNILFRLADCEHPLPPPPSGADALRILADGRFEYDLVKVRGSNVP